MISGRPVANTSQGPVSLLAIPLAVSICGKTTSMSSSVTSAGSCCRFPARLLVVSFVCGALRLAADCMVTEG